MTLDQIAVGFRDNPHPVGRLQTSSSFKVFFHDGIRQEFFPEDRIAYEENAITDICDQYHCSSSEGLAAVQDANVKLQGMLNGPWEGDVYWKDRQKGACLEIVFQNGLDKVSDLWNTFTKLAGEYGIRVVVPLLNNWQWMGGRPDYAAFRDKESDEFWTDPQLIKDFKKTIDYVLNRTNTITGVFRIRQTFISFLVWASTPLAASITIMTLSAAVSVLKVSSAKSW